MICEMSGKLKVCEILHPECWKGCPVLQRFQRKPVNAVKMFKKIEQGQLRVEVYDRINSMSSTLAEDETAEVLRFAKIGLEFELRGNALF